MSRLGLLATATVTAVSSIALAAAAPAANANVPGPGDTCTVLHATARDTNGRTMWCNPTIAASHSLVWQYGEAA